MNIKNFITCLFIIMYCIFSSCKRKHSKIKLGETYYKLAQTELSLAPSTMQGYKKALFYSDEALKEEQKASYYALKATLLLALDNKEEAAFYFRRALHASCSEKEKAEIQNNYACCLAAQGKKEEASYVWNALLKNVHYLTPEVVLINQAKCFFEEKKYHEAYSKIEEALQCAPAYVDAYYYKAFFLYHHFKNPHAAFNAAQEVLNLEPAHKGAFLLLSSAQNKKL